MVPRLPAAELAARRRAARSCAATAGTLVLVTEDEPAFFKIIGRHLDRHPISRQRLDAVLFHLAVVVGNGLLSRSTLHPLPATRNRSPRQSFHRDPALLPP